MTTTPDLDALSMHLVEIATRAAIGAGASVVGHAGMSWLLQRHPVTVISPLTLPTPLLSVIFGVIVLGTPLSPQMIAGGAVALVGVAIITLRTARARAREEGA